MKLKQSFSKVKHFDTNCGGIEMAVCDIYGQGHMHVTVIRKCKDALLRASAGVRGYGRRVLDPGRAPSCRCAQGPGLGIRSRLNKGDADLGSTKPSSRAVGRGVLIHAHVAWLACVGHGFANKRPARTDLRSTIRKKYNYKSFRKQDF